MDFPESYKCLKQLNFDPFFGSVCVFFFFYERLDVRLDSNFPTLKKEVILLKRKLVLSLKSKLVIETIVP